MNTEHLESSKPVTAPVPPPVSAVSHAANGAPAEPSGGGAHTASVEHPRKWKLDWRVATVVLLVGISIFIWRGVAGRASANIPVAGPAAAPTVAVARIGRQDIFNEVTIPAEFRPFADVELHAKVSGYVKELTVDIGDRVKAGQLLATLEVPELQDDLNRALAMQKRAEADYHNAHLGYTRLLAVEKEHPNLVAQQELDTAEAQDRTTEAAIASARAEAEKFETLLKYTKITAPFDGVVTYRFCDPGALIQAGITSATQSLPLVRISDNYRLRLDFPVSVAYVKDIHVGDRVEVRVESLGGKVLSGKITRSAQEVSEDTRTMRTEIEVPNEDLSVVPGMYATVVLPVDRRSKALVIPVQAIATAGKTTAYVVNSQNQVEARPITVGLEIPGGYEVLAGLKEGDLVIVGNRSEVKPGQQVEPKLLEGQS